VDKDEALERLRELIGRDLHEVARLHGVTVGAPCGKYNKGWAGHAIERHLGLQLNSSRSPNLGGWELKVTPLTRKEGRVVVKETMAITMIDPPHVIASEFEESHLFLKLRRLVCVGRIVGSHWSEPSPVHSVHALRLEGDLREAVKRDYELVRDCLRDPERGFDALTGWMGVYVQPRTKGTGGCGVKTRAFYARKVLLETLLRSA